MCEITGSGCGVTRSDDVAPVRPRLTLRWSGKTAPVPDYAEVSEPVRPAPHVMPPASMVLRVDPWCPPGPLDECLACWKTWMHDGIDRDLGAKPMGGLVGDTDGHGVDVHEQQQARDGRIAAATDAMIESLDRIHIWAIYQMCSIATPWRFPNANIFTVGEEAREALTQRLKKNVCTAVLF